MMKCIVMFICVMGVGMIGDRCAAQTYEIATFAGGCFWCMEEPFETMDGVITAVSGYTGGQKPDPTYEEVCSGTTGHREAIQITFDPAKISYETLLDVFWRQIDPTDAGGQFADRGSQYATAIYYHSDEQQKKAEASKQSLAVSGRFRGQIVTDILPAQAFYEAEAYHQGYYKTCSLDYKAYKKGSGREAFITDAWRDAPAVVERGPLSRDELKKKLTPLQFNVTQQCGTEPPFKNAYWDNKREGIYVDIVSGEPLFSSLDKFDSRSGWPSFTKPLEPGNVTERDDTSASMRRIEVRSKTGDSHLGHVFDDGPGQNGLRYCINSASLRFIAKEDLEKEGYGAYNGLFSDARLQ